jgi:NarL family two-component system response regulator LiaR
MKKTIILYGLALAALVTLLKVFEYQYFVRDLSQEFYIGLIAVLFTGVGIWSGLRLTQKKIVVLTPDFKLDERMLERTGLSKREHEVLGLISQGLSNQEIADKLFVSVNTVKSHLSSLFLKLEVGRRTQAIQKGKALKLIP